MDGGDAPVAIMWAVTPRLIAFGELACLELRTPLGAPPCLLWPSATSERNLHWVPSDLGWGGCARGSGGECRVLIVGRIGAFYLPTAVRLPVAGRVYEWRCVGTHTDQTGANPWTFFSVAVGGAIPVNFAREGEILAGI